MTRLEKKCLLASTGAHATLALLLFLGPLIWVSKRQNIALPPLLLVPTRIIDGVIASGGNPNATAPPAPPAPAPSRPATAPPVIAPPKPAIAPPKPDTKPIRAEVEAPSNPSSHQVRDALPDKRLSRTEEPDDSASTKPARHKIQVSFERETATSQKSSSSPSSSSASDSRSRAEARAVQTFQSKINGVVGAISQGVAGGTAIEVPGPGGEVYADYGQYLILAYRRAWTPPDDLTDELATVDVRIIVLREGTILKFRVVKKSGISALDRSVERLETAVRHVEPFPEGAVDPQRTFLLHFNLKSYRE
jgi:TonB family protein